MMSSYFSLYREQHFLHSKLRVVGVQRVHGKWSETIPTRKTDFLSLYSQGKCDIINL